MEEDDKWKTFELNILRIELINWSISTGKSDWIDLRASETVELKAGEFKLIPLGVAMELLPKGYEAHVVPRSSTFKDSASVAGEQLRHY